jgi:hypothetical protein
MTRVPAENPTESWEGPSDPEPIQIGEATGPDNPEFQRHRSDHEGVFRLNPIWPGHHGEQVHQTPYTT